MDYTDRAKMVMELAQQEAKKLNHDYIGTEHILLGLANEDCDLILRLIANALDADTSYERIRSEVMKLVTLGPSSTQSGTRPRTPRANRVLELAQEAAKQLGSDFTGTKHILLGLLKESDGIASQVLIKIGLRTDDVVAEIVSWGQPPTPKCLKPVNESLGKKKFKPTVFYNAPGDSLEVYLEQTPHVAKRIDTLLTLFVSALDSSHVVGLVIKNINKHFGKQRIGK